jgi:hypothetical protein
MADEASERGRGFRHHAQRGCGTTKGVNTYMHASGYPRLRHASPASAFHETTHPHPASHVGDELLPTHIFTFARPASRHQTSLRSTSQTVHTTESHTGSDAFDRATAAGSVGGWCWTQDSFPVRGGVAACLARRSSSSSSSSQHTSSTPPKGARREPRAPRSSRMKGASLF